MVTEPRLVICNHGTIRRGNCVVCGRPYESVGTGVLLWDGVLPRGYVCVWCLEAGPDRAADLLGMRAMRTPLMTVAQRQQPVRERAVIRRRLRQRADAMARLAKRLPGMAGWEAGRV